MEIENFIFSAKIITSIATTFFSLLTLLRYTQRLLQSIASSASAISTVDPMLTYSTVGRGEGEGELSARNSQENEMAPSASSNFINDGGIRSNRRRNSKLNRLMIRFLGLMVGYIIWYNIFLELLEQVKHRPEGAPAGSTASGPWFLNQGNVKSHFKELLREFKIPTARNHSSMKHDRRENTLVSSSYVKENNSNVFLLSEQDAPKAAQIAADHEIAKKSYEERSVNQVNMEAEGYHWKFDSERLKRVQKLLQEKTRRLTPVLTAYVEASPAVLEELGNIQNTSNVQQQPLRTQFPDSLKKYTYEQLRKCSDVPSKLPVNQPVELNSAYKNTNNRTPLLTKKFHYAKYCPVDADPYLPWIHDIFPSTMNLETSRVEHVEIIAQNKRRCNTDENRFANDLKNLEPQVAIMQPVPIKRISSHEARFLAPELWSSQPHQSLANSSSSLYDSIIVDSRASVSRYRLATYEDADKNSQETRFICRFHTLDFGEGNESTLRKVILAETLSVFPYNYEYVAWRKDSFPMLSKGGSGANNCFWNSVQHFRCPIPSHLQQIVGHDKSVINDAATVYLDLVPIRTRVRLGNEEYFTEDMAGDYVEQSSFDPKREWGEAHVLPEVEASGRWENIPLCASPMPGRSPNDELNVKDLAAAESVNVSVPKKHTLMGCVWASATFTARGNSPVDSSPSSRLFEWLTYHLYVANMDHIYVYDNSGAHTNEISLLNITNLFPRNRVTRIDWPFAVCNNNSPTHANAGERSSQYAAEASCRLRFGPFTDFLASFDIDEYLIPMGNWTNLKQWIAEGVDKNTNILTFKSARASPNYDYMQPYWDGGECGINETNANCVIQRPDALYLETYNCGKKFCSN
jgi:hypothetical protein